MNKKIKYLNLFLNKLSVILFLLTFEIFNLSGQNEVSIAFLADLHVNPDSQSDSVLHRIVDEINAGDFDFTIVAGDLINTGSDAELTAVKRALDKLKMPCHVLPGNHETKWAVSGGFGYEHNLCPFLATENSVIAATRSVELVAIDPLKKAVKWRYKAGNTSINKVIQGSEGKFWFRLWGLNPAKAPDTSFTIGIDTPEVIKQKVLEAVPYKVLKVKLGLGDDQRLINTIRSVTDKPVCVDVNQGWNDRTYALEMAHWLRDQNVLFIEQPMPKEQIDDIAWLTMNSPLPVVADEAVQTADDVVAIKGVYSGINIKLMKCGGLKPALEMAHVAKSMGLKIMIGCMTETSCAISAASQLSPLAQWADLDGNLLITNDCYQGTTIINGKITLNENPCIGVIQKIKIFHD